MKNKIRQHLDSYLPDIISLLRSGRNDLDVIAIILTEAFFRSKQIRVLEYLIFQLLRYIGHPRSKRVSLGMAQVQARHWRIPVTLHGILSPMTAYDMTIRYWNENNWISLSLPKKIARHVGELRIHYLHIAMVCRDEAQKWARHLINSQIINLTKKRA